MRRTILYGPEKRGESLGVVGAFEDEATPVVNGKGPI